MLWGQRDSPRKGLPPSWRKGFPRRHRDEDHKKRPEPSERLIGDGGVRNHGAVILSSCYTSGWFNQLNIQVSY